VDGAISIGTWLGHLLEPKRNSSTMRIDQILVGAIGRGT
jgi:hypothetical protein